MLFRKDINSLRAIAVIAVVLFHFNSSFVQGGFAGVDVFFVISGYLMTGIVFRNNAEDFTLTKFLSARATRIIPALFILCTVLMIYGYLFLYIFDFKLLLKHVKESGLFYSNIAYYKESGYFDSSSHYKWLLHTWSLSVEWQFYVIFPVAVILMKKIMSINSVKIIFLLTTIASFLLCVYASYRWPEASYYLLPTRSWELMLGGLAYLYPMTLKDNHKRYYQIFGLLLIVVSYVFISKTSVWPGYLALFPVLGTFLIIQSRRDEGWFSGNIILQTIGLWSYSIYLWHWPLVVAYNLKLYSSVLFGLSLSLILGGISYTIIEKRKFNIVETLYVVFISFSVFLFCSYAMNSRSIDLTSDALKYQKLRAEKKIFMNSYSVPSCNFKLYNEKADRIEYKGSVDSTCINKLNDKSILIWGDSYAQHLNFGLNKSYQDKGVDILQIATFSCRVTNSNVSDLACEESNAFFWESISTIKPDVILISQRNNHLKITKGFINKIKKLTDSEILLVGPSPEWDFETEIREENGSESIYRTPNNLRELENDRKLKEKFRNIENFKYISMFDSLCKFGETTKCLFLLGEEFSYMQADGGHFSRLGSEYVAEHILKKEIDEKIKFKTGG